MRVNEIFLSIQGEGVHTGCPAIFIRFSGCNLDCNFCDTDYSKFTELSAYELFDAVDEMACSHIRMVVITGGEPLLQDEADLVKLCGMLTYAGFSIELETNGTIPISDALKGLIQWISFSPKTSREKIMIKGCTSLKVLHPYLSPAITAEAYLDFPAPMSGRFIQPIALEDKNYITQAVAEVKRLGSPWRLGVQVHKLIGEK